jgi:hypothetical protein
MFSPTPFGGIAAGDPPPNPWPGGGPGGSPFIGNPDIGSVKVGAPVTAL